MTNQRVAVRHLEEDFADAMQRLYAVGNGLARLRLELDREAAAVADTNTASPVAPGSSSQLTPPPWALPAQPPTAPESRPAPANPPAPASTPPLAASERDAGHVAYPQPTPLEPLPRWWQREGEVTRVLGIAGAVITLAGVAMLLVLAMQHGWFGPAARVAAGGALAVALVAAAYVVRSREVRAGRTSVGPVAIAGTGYAAAYLDIVAMTLGYGWVPVRAGLVLAGLVAAGGLYLARLWDSQLLGIITVLGAALLGPAIAEGASLASVSFLVVLSLASWPAQIGRSWPGLTCARLLPTSALLTMTGFFVGGGSTDATVLLVLAALLAGVTVLTETLALAQARDAGPLRVLCSVWVGVTAMPLLQLVSLLGHVGRTVVFAVVATAYLVATTVVRRRPVGPLPMTFAATLGSVGTLALLIAVVSGAPDRHVGSALLVTGAAYLAVAGATHARLTLALGTVVTAAGLLAYLEPASAVADRGIFVFSPDTGVVLLDSMLVGAAVAVGVWAVSVIRGLSREVRLGALVVAWVAGLASSAAALVSLATMVGNRLGDASVGFTAGHALATMAWMGAAAWLLVRGLKHARDTELPLRLGLLLAGVSVAKLFLFDLAALDGVWRVAAFLVTGLLLLATGTSYARALERSRDGRPPTDRLRGA